MKRGGETECRTKRYLIRELRKNLRKERSCGTRGRENSIFVIAPIELLETRVVVVIFSFSEYIRSLCF